MSVRPTPGDHALAVIGGGTMGRGIAYVAMLEGFEVRIHDVDDDAAREAGAAVGRTLDKALERGKLDADARVAAFARLETTTDIGVAVRGAALVVEAVPESIELKAEVYAALADHLDGHAVLATNTSSLPVTELAARSGVAERFVGMHFFNPPYALKLLELVRAQQTSEATLETARAWAAALRREVVEVGDFPGFATSRLGIAIACEAMRMVDQGVAAPADIDRAMRLGYGFPMGPLELTDLVGLDIRLAIAEHLCRELGSETFRPPLVLRRLVRAGRLGRKTGHGFYRWVDGRKVEEPAT